MNETRRWLEYFRANQGEPEEIPWDQLQELGPPLRTALVPSLQQFQLGENAAGVHFLELARSHARVANDPDFPEAIALFIAEEQRHSRMLGDYLRRTGAPLLQRHWMHSVFRLLRHWTTLEGKVAVLVTAEIMAIPYYRAVMAASPCPVLGAICRRILREEARHLRFQGNTLRALCAGRTWWMHLLTAAGQRIFLGGTCLTTWWEHRAVFRLAGLRLRDVWRLARAARRLVYREIASAREMCNYA
jgi:hypothetical protein